jgi:hypothetical protein
MNLGKEKIIIGYKIAEWLNLKALKDYNPSRYNTRWGTKTALGLYESITRIIEEGGKTI